MTTPLFPIFEDASDFIVGYSIRESGSEPPIGLIYIKDDTPETGFIKGKFMCRYVSLTNEVRDAIRDRMSEGMIGSMKCIYWPATNVTAWWAQDRNMIASVLVATTPECHPWATNKAKEA